MQRNCRRLPKAPVNLAAVIDEAFFLTVAGIAMSFAGFAGLMNAFRRRGESWAPMELYQLRIIVAYAITTLFGSLSTIPFVELFGQKEGLQWLGGVMLIASSGLGFGNMLSDIRARLHLALLDAPSARTAAASEIS
jgi:hypothetical protein